MVMPGIQKIEAPRPKIGPVLGRCQIGHKQRPGMGNNTDQLIAVMTPLSDYLAKIRQNTRNDLGYPRG